MKKTVLIYLIVIFFSFNALSGDDLSITGVDTTGILINGTVDVYVSLKTEDPEILGNLGAGDFTLEELSPSGDSWKESPIADFQYNGFSPEEISLLLLIDNSGSMYDSLEGKPETDREKQRIFYLVSALRNLFEKTGGIQGQSLSCNFQYFSYGRERIYLRQKQSLQIS